MSYFTRTLPFTTSLSPAAQNDPLRCERLLRCLPGKRLVFQGTWRQKTVLVKLFLDPVSARRHWAREKAGCEAMMASGAPCPELLLAGQLDDGVPVLLFEFLPEAKTALELWSELEDRQQRANFMQQLVTVVGILHDSGLVQQDLHLGNFLFSDQRLYAIDGDAIDVRNQNSPLDLEASSGNLALFFSQFTPDFDELMEEAVSLYALQRNLAVSELLHRVSIELPQVRRRRRHKYVEKCYRSCSEFVRFMQAGYVSISRRDQQGETLTRFLDDPDRFMASGDLLKDGNSSTVVRVRSDDCDWVIKRYNIKSLRHALSRCLRPTRAWVSWGNAHRLKISGIETPRPVALLEKRIGPLRSTGYYVCDFVAGVDAEEYFQDATLDDVAKKQVAEGFVRLFGLFRKLNIVHGDCKATNFLLNKGEPWVLDLDAMHECSSPAQFEKLFRADIDRFLRNWSSQPALQRWFERRLP